MTDTVRHAVTVRVSEAIMYATITEIYNNGHAEWIATDGTSVILSDGRTPCDECCERIPSTPGGSLANRHHAESCSLYAPAGD